ncbi:MAG: M20/M25/M40 family metallo-hydrolase [Lutibacter sp.]|jgi:endoglucanase
MKDILKKLCLQPGVSGYEKKSGISTLIFKLVKKINSDTKFDSLGNIISVIGHGKKIILLEAHMDEIGFVVKKVNGLIKLIPQGIIKGEKIENSNAFIVNKNIIGKITIVPKTGDFVFKPKNYFEIDKINAGDIVALKRNFSKKGSLIKASALDNRVGCAVLFDIIKNIKKRTFNDFTFVFIFSVGEEINSSSFKKIVNNYGGDFAIIIDAAYAQPVEFNINKINVSIPVLGKGCAVQTKGKGFNIQKKIIKEIENIAKKNGVRIQKESAPDGLGKTNFSQMLKTGIKKGVVINTPVKNQHNEEGVTNISDSEESIKLILNILYSLKKSKCLL